MAVTHVEPEAFNTFLRAIKESYSGVSAFAPAPRSAGGGGEGGAESKRASPSHHTAFWDMVKNASISLISSDEVSRSSVTASEAEAFLADLVEETGPGVPVAETVTSEEDDMFGCME